MMTPDMEHIDTSTNQYPHIQVRHLEEWRKSGVDDDIISRNVWSIDDSQECDKLLNRNTQSRWKNSDELVPGWAVAGVSPKSGERTYKGSQFKPDNPPLDPRTQKVRKYLSPSKTSLSPLFLQMSDPDYWQKLMFDFQQPFVITEGAKKAGASLSLGIPCISLPGVSTGGKLSRLRPELELFCRYGRNVYLAFDRDIVKKPQVKQALHNLGRMLAAKGCQVHVVSWPDEFKGLDDWLITFDGNFLARQHFLSAIGQAQTLEEWRECQQDKDRLTEGETCRLALRYEMVSDKLRGRVRWNTLKEQPEIDGQLQEIDDIRLYLAIRHNIDVPKDDCCSIITYLAKQNSYSPIQEYLKECHREYGQDEDLLDSLAEKYLGANSTLHRIYLRKTLIAAAARAFTPGCKVDTVCIFNGSQGVGKSSFWRILAGEWFDDSFGRSSDKDERTKIHRSWILEWAELEALFRRKDISEVKSFITTQRDIIRLSYGREFKEMARPSIFVGTTNWDEFLGDSTGNRRFWVIPVVTPKIPLDELQSERDRIWSAATHAFLSGESWQLPSEYRQLQAEENEQYLLSDPWETPVAEYIEDKEQVTVDEVLINALHVDIDRHDKASQMRVSNLLKQRGWAKDRVYVGKKRLRVWIPPKDADLGSPGCPNNNETLTEEKGQPIGQPIDQPPGQPPVFPKNDDRPDHKKEEWDNQADQPDHFPKSSRTQDFSLCEPSSKAYGRADGANCEAVIGDFWEPAIYLGERQAMKICPECENKLTIWHRVKYLDGKGKPRRKEVCGSCSFRPELILVGDRVSLDGQEGVVKRVSNLYVIVDVQGEEVNWKRDAVEVVKDA